MKTKILISILFLVLQSCNKTIPKKTEKQHNIKKDAIIKLDSTKQDTLSKNQYTEVQILPLSKLSRTKIIVHKGYLGDIANKYYGNKAYYLPLAAYNNLKNGYYLKEKTSINIPPLPKMLKDSILGTKPLIHQEIEAILQAKDLFTKHEEELWQTIDNRQLSKTQMQDLNKASQLIYKTITDLSNLKNAPKKMIGQLKSVAINLDNLSNGKSDGYGYDLDMVHQRLAHAFRNAILWSIEK